MSYTNTPLTDPGSEEYTGAPAVVTGVLSGGNTGVIWSTVPSNIGVISGGNGITQPTISGNSIFNTGFTSSKVSGQTIKSNSANSADLPDICFKALDEQKLLTLTLRPESTISAHEALKLSMMLVASITNPNSLSFCPLAFIRKHSLERHFTFS